MITIHAPVIRPMTQIGNLTVGINTIGVSTALRPMQMIADLEVCTAVVGVKPDIARMVHLSPAGHYERTMPPRSQLVYRDFVDFALRHKLPVNSEKNKRTYLECMLEGIGGEVTVVGPVGVIYNGMISPFNVMDYLRELGPVMFHAGSQVMVTPRRMGGGIQ